MPKCPARSFHNRAPEHIPEALRPALGPIVEQIGSLTECIKDYDRKLEEVFAAPNPVKKSLEKRSALTVLNTLGAQNEKLADVA